MNMSNRRRRRRKTAKGMSTVQVFNRSGTPLTAEFWPRRESDAGVAVNTSTALEYAPLYYAVQKIAGHIGIIDLELKRRLSGGQVVDTARGELRVRELVLECPNELMTAVTWKELSGWQSILQGNGRTAIIRQGTSVSELIPMPAERTRTVIVRREQNEWLPEKWHYSTTQNGGMIWVPDGDCHHVMNLSRDGLVGLSLVDLARNSLGGGLAAEQYANKTYKNNAVPSLILEAPEGVFSDDAEAQDFIDNFNRFHSGSDNASKVGMLRHGIKANPYAMSGRDAQFIENRKFAREEAALWTSVESMLGVESSVSYNSLQQRNQAYMQNGLLKWLVKWKQESDRKLLSERERQAGYFFKWNVKKILEGSTKERYESYEIARRIGLQSQEEQRIEEGMPPPDPAHNFDNPNTTAGGSQPAGDSAGDDSSARLRAVITNQIEWSFQFERDNLLKIARGRKPFVAEVESFLGRYTKTLARLVESLGGDAAAASDHTSQSMELISETASSCDAGKLRTAVQREMENWVRDGRGQSMVESILSNGVHNAA